MAPFGRRSPNVTISGTGSREVQRFLSSLPRKRPRNEPVALPAASASRPTAWSIGPKQSTDHRWSPRQAPPSNFASESPSSFVGRLVVRSQAVAPEGLDRDPPQRVIGPSPETRFSCIHERHRRGTRAYRLYVTWPCQKSPAAYVG